MLRRTARKYNPLTDLILNIRVAAKQINVVQARKTAAREADRIPLTMIEKAHGKRGEMAKLARQIMRQLPHAAPENFAALASELLGCADAVQSTFEIASEVELGRKPRHTGQAA